MRYIKFLFLIFFLFVGTASAQDNKLYFSPWKKVCESIKRNNTQAESNNCVVERFAFKEKDLTIRIAGISVQTVKDKNEFGIAIISPLGVKIPYGVEIQIPNMKPIKLPFSFCDRPGCFSQFVADKSLVDNMLKVNFIQLKYQLMNDQYLELSFDISEFEAALKKLNF